MTGATLRGAQYQPAEITHLESLLSASRAMVDQQLPEAEALVSIALALEDGVSWTLRRSFLVFITWWVLGTAGNQ
jgi:hypothetical protein